MKCFKCNISKGRWDSRFLDIMSLPDSLPRVREARGPAAGASAEAAAAVAAVGTRSAAWAARLSAESAAVAASATDSST